MGEPDDDNATPAGGQTDFPILPSHGASTTGRGIPTEIYRDIARMHGRMVGTQYAEGLDVGRMLLA